MKRFKRILLVDDDHVCNYLSKEILEGLDIAEEIFMANNGKEALEMVNKELSAELDIILLDLNMPIMDGFVFLKKLYFKMPDWNRRFKIIILTSSTSDENLELLRPTPIDGLIVKPLTPERLIEIFDIVVGKKEEAFCL